MKELEYVKFLDRMIARGGDKQDKVNTYIKYLKYAEVYDETSENFKKLFEPNVLALILDGKCTFLDAYITLSKTNLHESGSNKKKGTKDKEKNSSSSASAECHSINARAVCHSSNSSSSCHSSNSSSSCHSSHSIHSCGSSTSRGACYSSSGC